jgi:adenylate cyclase
MQSLHTELVASSGYSNAFTGIGDPYLPFREILYQLSGDIQTHWKAGSLSRQSALNLWKTIPLFCKSLLKHGPDLVDTILPGQTLLEHAESYAKTQPAWYRELQAFVAHKKQHPGSSIQQANLLSQFTAVLQNIAREVPLLLFVDDLQWADTGTIAMFFHLAKQIPGSRIMLVGAYRSEEVSFVDEGGRHPLAPVLHELKRDYGDVFIYLDESSGKEFVQEMIESESHDLEESFQEQLYHLTGGNALFTVEILQSLAETGTLTRDGSGFRVLSSDFRLGSLPPRIEGILAERIGRLPQNLQSMLQLASIEGEIFTAEIIAAMEEMPIEQVVSLLSDQLDKQHRLVRAQQIRWQDDRSISTYRFRHFLFQKFLYDQLDEISRARFHNRVGSMIETMYKEDIEAYAVHLARHFHEANQTEKAVKYYSIAGSRAVRMSAYPEAISQFEAAIKLLLTLPETPDRNEQELNLQLQLGVAYQSIMGYAHEQVGAAYQRALNLCQTLGESNRMMITLQLLLSYYANIAELQTANEILTMLREINYEHEPAYTLNLHWGHGYLESIIGKHKSAFDQFTQAMEYYDPEVHQTLSEIWGTEPGILCHGWSGLHAAWLGYPERANTHIQAALKIAESYHSKLFTSFALWFSNWVSLELKDMTLAREYNPSLLEIATKEKYMLFEIQAHIFRGRILSSEGKHQEALESIEEGLVMFSMTGMVIGQTTILLALAEAHCAAGQVEAGLDVISKAEQFEQETGEARHLASLQKVKGDLYLLGEDEDSAEKAYLSAISVAQRESAKLLELEAVKPLARLWQHQGKGKQAMRMLQEIYDWFTEGFDTPMLVEARKLLEDLASENQ